MSTHPLDWFATSGTTAAWFYCLQVEGNLDDVHGAANAGDWPTTIEASASALIAIGTCEAILHGQQVRTLDEAVLIAILAMRESVVLEDLAALEPAMTATNRHGQAAVAAVQRHAARVRALIPLDIPSMRTPEGFFPALRLGRQLEGLRDLAGLPPFTWHHWTV